MFIKYVGIKNKLLLYIIVRWWFRILSLNVDVSNNYILYNIYYYIGINNTYI